MQKYSKDIENKMSKLYKSLSEKDRRRYAAIESMKLGHGGIAYISELFKLHPDTINQGITDLDNNTEAEMMPKSIRKKGAVENSQQFVTA